MTAPLRLGIDLGGTKIEIAALDAAGAFVLRQRTPTPAGDYDAILDAIAHLVAQAESELGQRRLPLGIGIPGSESPVTGRVRNANSTALNGRPLRADLQTRLQRHVALENDANCLALSEATDGAGAGADVVFAAILGTGVGAGVAVHGRVLHGCNGIAGEWGHNPLPPGDAAAQVRCWCGRTGCVEVGLSGPGFAADHARGLTPGSVPPPNAEALVTAVRAGDAAASASFARYAERLARALAQVMNVLDPDVVVLGGGMSNVAELYQRVPRLWGAHLFSDTVRTRLLPAQHGDSSGVRGAAWLAQAD